MSDKQALRNHLRAVRAAVMPQPIGANPAFVARLARDTVVASYFPCGNEADPADFVASARRAGAIVALPHVVDRTTTPRFLRWDAGDLLVAGPFGLTQPALDAQEVRPTIVLTPLVGFDRRGHRLGQGAGHYDRAFAANPGAWRVGIAWSVQEVERVPTDRWDVPLDAIATEREWIVR